MDLRIEPRGILKLLDKQDDLPYELLLLADETIEAISRYIHQSDIYVFELDQTIIATMVLQETGKDQIEIKNIAVATEFQGKGVGSFLLQKACEIAVKKDYRSILIGTGDQSLRELALYERSGFEKFRTVRNFFIDNYPSPIYENGKQLMDMIVLKKDLKV
jgi:ribosomal protein S18 acetylase RimI-like enzyme